MPSLPDRPVAGWDPKKLFVAALDLPVEERAPWLERECADDADLLQRVRVLLAAHDAPESVVGRLLPPQDQPEVASTAAHLLQGFAPGAVIAGRYKLRETLGEGGMGVVFVAEQTAPVQRRVALKIIRSTLDTQRLLARFEQERQALALMDHPNIAKVFDAGVDEAGRPYFAMELVKGLPLSKYCDDAKLSPRARLELFVPVCQAVQHAHQKGIIHRDLKPSNILVGLYDGRPVPKVIDFGVAKATGPRLTEQSIYTEVGSLIGTLEYMSPEQAELNNLDIDTRSDVYALGVILYELMTGAVPFSRKDLNKAGFAEMLRVIRESEPVKPSTKLSGSGTLPSIAAQRQMEPKKLTALMRGELDWIVMKALSKERDRRYETANGFAMDVQRYLSGEAVQAHPPSTAYRLKKFVRRNRPQVIAASLILFALLAGVVGTTLGLVEARRQTELARDQEAVAVKQTALARAEAEAKELARAEEARQRGVAEAEKKRADEQRTIAWMVNEFLQGVLLDQADTTAQANMLLREGDASSEAKHNPTIRELLDRAAKALAPDKIEKSMPNQPLVQAEILQTVGNTYCGIGEAATAIDFLKRSDALYRKHLGPDHPTTLASMNNLAGGYRDAGQLDLALPLFEETLKLNKAVHGPDHRSTLASMNNLALGYQSVGKLDLALALFEETLKVSKAKLGLDHPDTLTSMNNLATVYQYKDKLDLALALNVETLKLRKAKLGPDHPETLRSMGNVAAGYWSLHRLDQSIPLFEELLPLVEKKQGRAHPETQTIVANLGVNYKDAGRLSEAIPLLEEAYTASKKHVFLRRVGFKLLDAHVKAGKPAAAKKFLDDVFIEIRKEQPKESPQLAGQLAQFGSVLLEMKGYAEAEPFLHEALTIREKTQPDVWNTFNTQSMLGGALLGQKKYADAEPLLVKGYEEMKAREKTIPPQAATRIPEALDRLVELCTATNKPEEVKKWQAERAKFPPMAASRK